MVAGIVAFVVLGACATSAKTYTVFQDETVPWQEQAMVLMYIQDGYVFRIELDGKKERVKNAQFQLSPPVRIIPTGTHTLAVWVSGNNNTGGGKRELKHDFQTGERYVVLNEIRTRVGLGVIGKNRTEIVPLDQFREKLKDFYPGMHANTIEFVYNDILSVFTEAENKLNTK